MLSTGYMLCVVYIYSAGYVELPCNRYCSAVSILMLGVSHAIQNKKLLKFTQSDSVYVSVISTLMFGASHAVEVLVLCLLVVV